MNMRIFVLIGICFLFIASNAFAVTYNVNLDIRDEQDYEQMLNITIYKPGTNQMIVNEFTYDNVSFLLNDSKVDLEMDYDDSYLDVLIQDLSISNMNEKIIVNDAFPIIEGYNVLKGYVVQLPNAFSFSNIILKINYEDSYVIDESKIQLFKCSSFDFDSLNCSGSWTQVSMTKDTDKKIVVANLKSLSVYALVEPEEAEPEETTTTTPSATTITTQPTSGNTGGAVLTTTTTTSLNQTTTTTQMANQTITQTTTTTQTVVNNNFNQANPSFQPYLLILPAIAVILIVLFWRWQSGKKEKIHYHPRKGKKKYSDERTKLIFH